MKNYKFPLITPLSLTLIACTGLFLASPQDARADEPTFAEQRDAQLALSRDRIQQLRRDLDRVGTSLDLYPQDYITASRALLDTVEVSLTAFDARVLAIMSRFERPIVEYNQIASSSLSDAQKAIRLLPLDQEIDRIKEQASTDYQTAVRVLYDVIPGLPHLAQGSILHSNATDAQKAAVGCAADTRHIFKATFKNSSGRELFVSHQCVKASETATAYPRLAPMSPPVREQFYSQVLAPMLSQACQGDVCKQFLLLDYASVFQKISINLDKPMNLAFGRANFLINIPLKNPEVITWLVGFNLVASAVPSSCQTDYSGWYQDLAMGVLHADGEITPLGSAHEPETYLRDNSISVSTLERYRSRADLLVRGAAHFLHFIPVIGQVLYHIQAEDTGVLSHAHGRNSDEWRGNQIERTIARCNADLDQDYGGDRDRYGCESRGWVRSGPREQLRRERYYVNLRGHDPIVPVLGTITRRETRDRYNDYGDYNGQYEFFVTTDVYSSLFAKQLEATRACLARN